LWLGIQASPEKWVVEGFIHWLNTQSLEKAAVCRMDQVSDFIRYRKDTLMTYLEDG